MKITPWGKKIQLQIPTSKVGALNLSDGASIQEMAKVVAMGPLVGLGEHSLKVGNSILFKSWAVDVITIDEEKFYFIDIDSTGICAVCSK